MNASNANMTHKKEDIKYIKLDIKVIQANIAVFNGNMTASDENYWTFKTDVIEQLTTILQNMRQLKEADENLRVNASNASTKEHIVGDGKETENEEQGTKHCELVKNELSFIMVFTEDEYAIKNAVDNNLSYSPLHTS